jgi:hypothetical protein
MVAIRAAVRFFRESEQRLLYDSSMSATSPAASFAPETRPSRPLRVWLIVETILCIPAVALGGFAALMSPMMFDAPGSTSNPHVVALFWSVVAFPFACMAAVVLGWILFATRHPRAAFWFSLTPLIPLITGAIAAMNW